MGSIDTGADHPLLADDRASDWLGITVLGHGDGHATIAMTLRPEMMNGFGIAHGGMIFAFADSAFALACNPADGDGRTVTVAAGVDVNFLAPTRAGPSCARPLVRWRPGHRSGRRSPRPASSMPHSVRRLRRGRRPSRS